MAEYDSVIPAGESGKLTAKIHTNPSQNVALSKRISVATDAPGAENIRLTMKLESVAPILIRPRYQVYVNTMVGQPKTEKVLVHRVDGKALELELARPAPEGAKVTFKTLEKPDASMRNAEGKPGDVWLMASVDASQSSGTVSDKLILKTNHPEQPELVIPITMRVRNLIESRPAQARMWIDRQGGASRITVIRLVHNKGQRFKIKGLESSRPEIFEVSQTSPGEQPAHNIRIALVEGLDLEALEVPLDSVIRIRTSDPSVPELEVPMVISERVRPSARSAAARSVRAPSHPLQAPPGTLARPTRTPGPK